MSEILVSFDTDRIQEYVFATDKLRELRGASLLLDDLNTEEKMEKVIHGVCANCEIVYFAGGSGAVLVPSQENAQAVIAAVEKVYRDETFSASITGVSVPLAPETREQGVGKRLDFASFKLREAKDKKARRHLATTEPYTQPCSACERYPATRVLKTEQQPICDSCWIKRKTFDRKHESDSRTPKDLNEIGEHARPPGYIGFIYADGNNMGDRLKDLQSVADCDTFANGVDELINYVAKELPGAAYPVRHGKYPYETLLVGGDDMMLVTAGDIALPLTLQIARRFETESLEILRRANLPGNLPLTLGIGVVLAHASFPIAALNRLARQLCKRAKRRCAEENYQTSAIDFMVVTAAGSSDVKTVREKALSEQAFVFPHGDLHARLTQRPYTLDEADKLIEFAEKFKRQNFPSSQLHFLYEGIFHSLTEAVFRWRKVAGRVKKEHSKLMDDFHKELSAGEALLPPWRGGYTPKPKEEREYTPNGLKLDFSLRSIMLGEKSKTYPFAVYITAFGDLVEIYPFVHPAGGSNAALNS